MKILFVEILRLCAEAGLVKAGKVNLDGTKMKANASLAANRTEEALAKEIDQMLAEAAAKDAEEDTAFGKDRRGDELPENLRSRNERLKRLEEARERLERERLEAEEAQRRKLEERAEKEEATGKKTQRAGRLHGRSDYHGGGRNGSGERPGAVSPDDGTCAGERDSGARRESRQDRSGPFGRGVLQRGRS
jgi:hypothetical protein